MHYDFTYWQPLSVVQVGRLFAGLTVPWWVAGGQAIDLFVGYQTRPHGDTDVLIRRGDQLVVQAHLAGWDLHRATYPGLTSWQTGVYLDSPLNDIWCRRSPDAPWSLQLMLLDTQGDEWVFKRDRTIGGPLTKIGRQTSSGIPYLAPEIQLLYKAKSETLDKDQADFEVAAPHLTKRASRWLLNCLEKRFPDGHPWIRALRQDYPGG